MRPGSDAGDSTDPYRCCARDKNLAGDTLSPASITVATSREKPQPPSCSFSGVSDPERLETLRAEAQYARRRLDLYRARAYGMRPTRESRMRELQRAADAAEERYRTALEASRGE
jgi:hypothetical protein